MSELAEGARLEIVYTPKAYLGFESLSLRHHLQVASAAFFSALPLYTKNISSQIWVVSHVSLYR